MDGLFRLRKSIFTRGGSRFLPSSLANLEAWYRFNTGITVTGSGVSQWNDQTANARHLLQGTDASRPPQQGDGSILFDGTADFLKTAPCTLNQPETIYIRFKQVVWTANMRVIDGNAVDSGILFQRTTTPRLSTFISSVGPESDDLAVNTYGTVAVIFNGASTVLQVNNGTAFTGNVGAGNMGGLTIGAGAGGANPSNIQVKEVIVYSVAHSQAQRDQVSAYLGRI